MKIYINTKNTKQFNCTHFKELYLENRNIFKTYEQYLEYTGIHKETDNRKIVIYTRVSTSNQKDDLKNQVEFLRQYANSKGIID
ncbi:recombinase family protein [Clostridioides sp. ZZV15-6388]|nr:recombinase family protein [Clostridioides sp. ZZV15-6388]MCC0666044.1 recombinase family protein [Clostridioides sp. ZZV15-6597]